MGGWKLFFNRHQAIRRTIKVLGIILGSLAAAFLILVLVTAIRSAWGGYKWQKKADKFQAALEKPYREDTYGGKTPEQTWGLFLSALKQGDVELASRYFVVDKQASWRKIIQKTIEAGRIDVVLSNFPAVLNKEKDYLQGDSAYYYYELKDRKTGEVNNNSVVFYLNPYTKVWKILVL